MKNRTKVLIVEDEMPLAMLMVNVLTRVGCEVEAVCTGKKAMELAAHMRFDLITLDIRLPDANGLELCTELKQRCHRSLENQPAGVESKPATPRCFIHIKFLGAGKGFSISS